MSRPSNAAERFAVAMNERNAVTAVAHTNSGMRVHVMPGARILMIVTKKFRPVIVLDTPMRKIAMHHMLVPNDSSRLIGGYSVQPASGAPQRKLPKSRMPAGGNSQKLNMFSHGNATSRAPICSGMMRLPNAPVRIGMMTSQTIAEP